MKIESGFGNGPFLASERRDWRLFLCGGGVWFGKRLARTGPVLTSTHSSITHSPSLVLSHSSLSFHSQYPATKDTFMNAAYGATATLNFAQDAQQQQQFEEQPITTFFCRALYDYQSGDASSLSFHKNEIIEVLTRLESGWWDGLLGDERGWFPSNYVEIITDQEAEVALAPPQFQAQAPPADDTVIDIAGSMASALSSSSNDDWLLNGSEYSHPLHRPNGHSLPNGSASATQHNDFWVPKVSEDGRVRP